MVCRNVFRFSLVIAAILGGRPAAAGPIAFTGNVSTDFGITTPGQSPANSGVTVIAGSLNPVITTGAGGSTLYDGVSPGDDIKQVAVNYDSTNNTLYVGVQTWGVAGNVTGSTIASGNGMVVGFASLNGATFNPADISAPSVVAGTANVSTGQTAAAAGRGSGLDGFNVATYSGGTIPGTMNLLNGFGTTIAAGTVSGGLAFNPSSATPDYEFSIPNFSTVLGVSPDKGFVVLVQDGEVNVDTSKDVLFGVGSQAQNITPPPHTPEPTTWIVWTALAGGAAWRYRRRSRRLPA
jgi:hypothetical protein